MNNSDLSGISQITDNMYLSGIYPLEQDSIGMTNKINSLGIKYIICCVSKNHTAKVHDKLVTHNPNITVLYIPLDDILQQNLWTANKNSIDIKSRNMQISSYYNLYHNKPMIEIGFHFLEHVVNSRDKVLVHCMAGISRSVSLIVYYLMKKYHLDFDNALQFVKNKRKIANPNNSFKLQLKLYHVIRDQFCDTDADRIITQL